MQRYSGRLAAVRFDGEEKLELEGLRRKIVTRAKERICLISFRHPEDQLAWASEGKTESGGLMFGGRAEIVCKFGGE